MDVRYLDLNGNRILCNVRNIPDSGDEMSPYYIGEPQTNVIQNIDISANPIGDDFAFCYGKKAGLSRRTRKEHIDFLKRISNIEPLSQNSEDDFMDDECYIFASFTVGASDEMTDPMEDCLRQFNEMGIFDCSWNWIFTIEIAPGTTQQQILKWKWLLDCLSKYTSSNTVIGISIGRCESGERIKVTATRYFREYWPSEGEFTHWDIGQYASLKTLKKALRKVSPEHRDLAMSVAIANIFGEDEQTKWNEKKTRLDWLYAQGAKVPGIAIFNGFAVFRGSCQLQGLKWLFKHGGDVNHINEDGQTLLDNIEFHHVNHYCRFKAIKKRLYINGAKTLKGLIDDLAKKHDCPFLRELITFQEYGDYHK